MTRTVPATPAARRRAGRTAPLLAALSVAGLALTGCSTTTPSASSGSASSSGAASSAAKTVTIMTHDSFSLPDDLVKRFEQESGYTLKTTAPGDAGAVVNQLLLAKGQETVDGVYGIEDHSAHRLTKEGIVAPYTPAALPASAKDKVVDGRMVPVDRGQVCLNVDTPWFTDHAMAAPTSLEQVARPEYAKLTVFTSPVSSSPGLAFLAATDAKFGEQGSKDWWTQVLKGGAKVDASWSDAYNTDFSGGEGKGAYPIVLSYSSSPAFAPQTAVMESSCTPQTEYAGVVEGAKNAEGAKKFVDFMLSPDVQKAIPEAMYMYPIDEATPLPEEWTTHAQLVKDPITPDPAAVDARRDALLKDWTALREAAAR